VTAFPSRDKEGRAGVKACALTLSSLMSLHHDLFFVVVAPENFGDRAYEMGFIDALESLPDVQVHHAEHGDALSDILNRGIDKAWKIRQEGQSFRSGGMEMVGIVHGLAFKDGSVDKLIADAGREDVLGASARIDGWRDAGLRAAFLNRQSAPLMPLVAASADSDDITFDFDAKALTAKLKRKVSRRAIAYETGKLK